MDITALDTTMLITAMLALPFMILAVAVSAARLALTARTPRPMLAGAGSTAGW